MSIKSVHFTCKMLTYLYTDHKPLINIFTGHTSNEKVNIRGLEAAAILRRDKVKYIKGIATILANLLSRFKAVGIYHDIDVNNHQQEFSTSFEPLPSVELVPHTLLEVNEVVITFDIERLSQAYDTLHYSPTTQT